jgi:hypothetical protein
VQGLNIHIYKFTLVSRLMIGTKNSGARKNGRWNTGDKGLMVEKGHVYIDL